MKRILYYTIPTEYDGSTVRAFLERHGFSHAVLVLLKKTPKSILVNDIWYYVTDRLHTGDSMRILIDEPCGSRQIIPIALPFEIIYEDNDILVVNKPAGMPIHPSLNNYGNTLANGVMSYYARQNIAYTFRCINRLDKDTTGLTVLAKHCLSGAVLSRQMQQRLIKRTYAAIVTGITDECGTICAPIARLHGSAIERCVDFEKGESATTHFRRIQTCGSLSFIELHLDSGRTHQIRVHMKYNGHPLIGDFLYNPDFSIIKRQALHSCRLEFRHPITDEPLTFCAPLPDDMSAIFPSY